MHRRPTTAATRGAKAIVARRVGLVAYARKVDLEARTFDKLRPVHNPGGSPVAPQLARDVGTMDQSQLEAAAHALGERLGAGQIVLLHGEMGAGKTTFVRALARGLAVSSPDEVCSPTYTVCMTHEGPTPLVHLDLFRLSDMGDGAPVHGGAFESLGLAYDALPPPDSVLVVEWAKLWADPPPERLELFFERPKDDDSVRRLRAEAFGESYAALLGTWAPS